METGLLILRLVVGLVLAAHGAQKLFGWFGGHGIAGTGGWMESLGFRPGKAAAIGAGGAEFVGGLCFALGLLTPFAAAAILAVMVVASVSVHLEKGFWNIAGGYELPLINAVVVIGVAFTGPGPLSLDRALDLWLAGERWGLIALGLGFLGAIVALTARTVTVRRRAAA